MFDYILDLEELQIDQCGNSERSALFYALRYDPEEFNHHNIYFPLKLIQKGADVHLEDPDFAPEGDSFLSLVIWHWDGEDSLTLGQLAIEKGYDVNAQDPAGWTPLYEACLRGHLGMIHMLLYYGAIATIPLNDGILPIVVVEILTEDHANVVEILFRHTFEEGDGNIVNLINLVKAMQDNDDESLGIFSKLVKNISQIDYDLSSLRHLSNSLHFVKAKHFKLFVEKFGNVLQEMVENFSCLTIFIDNFAREIIDYEIIMSDVKGVLWTILESDCAAEFVQNINPSYPTIARLTQMLETDSKELSEIERIHLREEITEIVCLMLSYGLNVTSYDLNMVYARYGYCKLFKILLHMDIKMVKGQRFNCSMAQLYYDPSTDIETFFDKTLLSLDLLSYYNHPKLKNKPRKKRFLTSMDKKIAAKVRSLPRVPSLVELSRNMARKFIISRYQIKNSMQFYTVLRWLPIVEIIKKIIALERKLY